MSEDGKDNGFRYANIGLLVGISIMGAGVIVFANSSEAAMQATAMVGFVVAFVVYHYLDERDKRRKKSDPQ